MCCGEVAYSHACKLAASFPRERHTGSSSPTTLREGPEACEPGLRLGDKPSNPPRTQHLEPADPADPSGKPARDRLNDANLRVLKRNSSKPARAASCPWLQGCYSKRFQPYVGLPLKLHHQPAATADACCVGGCAAPSQPAHGVHQSNLPQHTCWRAACFVAPDNHDGSADGDNTIIGYSHAEFQAELRADLQAKSQAEPQAGPQAPAKPQPAIDFGGENDIGVDYEF